MISMVHSVGMAIRTLRSSRMRSFLTALGIIIGISAVIATTTIGTSFGDYMTGQLSGDSSNYLTVISYERNVLHDQQADRIRSVSGVKDVTAYASVNANMTYMGETQSVTIIGVKENAADVTGIRMMSGNFISDKDTSVIVIGRNVSEDSFQNEIGIRNSVIIEIKDQVTDEPVTSVFKVKGISGLEEGGGSFVMGGMDSNTSIFMPLSTLQSMHGIDYYTSIYVLLEDGTNTTAAADAVEEEMARSLGIPLRDLDDDSKSYSIPFTVFNRADVMDMISETMGTMQTFLLGIVAITLVVGSIGIMNIMLVTVTERTKEIGTLKALGYSSADVMNLFLTEAVIISFLGGIIGVILGLVVSVIVTDYLGISLTVPVSNVIYGILFAVLIGIIAGVYPAGKAAKMDPVDALRQE